ncbi:hypothetical protein [Blastochloris sulfoviridis]|uniref:Uncharacterized protein n=1 Tax=Blastochloris sulfoviridis TaxID=50712 RepID=A0A5M6HN80_9HYPH|nr:hypothetical protein [Blastochloris sulfoviridis]KAA5597306.1 hypothetical protein F1193_14335 [Blastochloris sulfoviridis]
MPGFIIEGVTGVGKSIVFKRMQALIGERHPANTKLLLSEHYTERVLEHAKEAGTLTEEQVAKHLVDLMAVPAMLKSMLEGSKFRGRAGNASPIVLMERFLLSHVANMRMLGLGQWQRNHDFVARLYAQADDCQIVRIVLRCRDEELPARVLSTRRHRNTHWSSHLDSLGDDSQIADFYRCWQRHLLDFAETHATTIQPVYVDIGADMDPVAFRRVADELYERHLLPRLR